MGRVQRKDFTSPLIFSPFIALDPSLSSLAFVIYCTQVTACFQSRCTVTEVATAEKKCWRFKKKYDFVNCIRWHWTVANVRNTNIINEGYFWRHYSCSLSRSTPCWNGIRSISVSITLHNTDSFITLTVLGSWVASSKSGTRHRWEQSQSRALHRQHNGSL